MLPLTALIAIPVLYAVWQRRRYRQSIANDPTRHISAETKRAMKRKDVFTAVYVISGALAATVGTTTALAGTALQYSPVWLSLAVISLLALRATLRLDDQIRREIGQ